MALKITSAQVRFKNGSNSSGTNSESPAAPKERTTSNKSNPSFPKLFWASLLILFLLLKISFFIAFIIFFQKCSQLPEEKSTTKQPIHTALECVKKNLTMAEKVWSCCPKNWKSFSSKCYFIATESKSWNESEKACSRMEAHLLVINTKDEQDFIIQNLDKHSAYFVGLSDPKGQRRWQWVDQTPYNKSATFWLPDEPSNRNERCVVLQTRYSSWGWNDVPCFQSQRSVCEMMNIYL
ncbi:C-type lectin domain family 4 member A-like isoform X1 [Eulemur rufifrons]|uniref:C-type lectin domain family 4 member A-like isoform X1 n=1 Tax=Eulemur rufifrons TaxID=859984 RepID=UPI0037426E04